MSANDLMNCFKMTVDMNGIKKLEEYISKLENENEELKKHLNELQKPQIFIDTQDIEERYGEELYQDYLKEKVEELKKQLEEKEKKYIPGEYAKEEYIKEFDKNILLKKQQQEFIKYLEESQFVPSITGEDFEEDYTITEVLQKYKEIIGDSDER